MHDDEHTRRDAPAAGARGATAQERDEEARERTGREPQAQPLGELPSDQDIGKD